LFGVGVSDSQGDSTGVCNDAGVGDAGKGTKVGCGGGVCEVVLAVTALVCVVGAVVDRVGGGRTVPSK
jgi:hypothetical protein